MAGIWGRIDGSGADRMDMHLLDAALVMYSTGAFTKAQILNGMNSKLGTPLAGAEITDLAGFGDALDAEIGALNKIIYLNKLRAWTIAAENGLVSEAAFRSALGI